MHLRSALGLVVGLLVVGCGKADSPEVAAKPSEAASGGPGALVGWVEVDPATPLATSLAAQAKRARQANHKPYAYLHAAWCPPCKAIDTTRTTDPQMKAAFVGTHIIAIDIDRVDDKQISAAGMTAASIPIFYRLDDAGRPTGAKISGSAWGDNIPANMAPPLTAFFAN